ncbi:MAG: APC family permease [Gammaproteobacteria bacterium]|nr:APC family permease [Gammaproteobacteria bacterium]MCP5425253.1 APC family permease [Gammaproteobacteria bacterium]
MLAQLRDLLLGKPLDPLNPATRQHVALAAFLAWVGLGADGLSSACYGPEQAFLALGIHTHLGLYLAFATALTVFIISLAYNQVIELFPSGGGGYKVASQLLGSRAGLVSGAALLVDYVLTISISVASSMDAVFSLLPLSSLSFKVPVEVALIVLLIVLNLRGMKESIKFLLPIFLGFFISHALLIAYGIYVHGARLPNLIPDTLTETTTMTHEFGWVFVASLFLRAYSLGGGTYTGLEAVSNNVNVLAEPRVKTGQLTMFLMAASLSLTAGGIILLYLLWAVQPLPGQTLNAVAFAAIIENVGYVSPYTDHLVLAVVLALEAGLLLVAANTGFLGGPAVLASMASDYWVPRQFRQLSSRLARQNGILLMGGAALLMLWWSNGEVSLLVVLYSINVFLTFSLSLLGLCRYWWRNHDEESHWRQRFVLSLVGFVVVAAILSVTVLEKFTEGGWITLTVTGLVIGFCYLIRTHYDQINACLERADDLYAPRLTWKEPASLPELDPSQPTAIFIVGKSRGVAMYSLQWIREFFPDHFKNFVFLAVGEVDAKSYEGSGALRTLQYKVENALCYYTSYCHSQGLAAEYRMAFGTDPVEEFTRLGLQATDDYPNSLCLIGQLMFQEEHFYARWLHNQTPLAVQGRLHCLDKRVLILPMPMDL